MPTRNHIDLVEKTLRILEIMSEGTGELRLKEIAERSGLVKSSAFRILFTLRQLGYAEQVTGEKQYRLTTRLVGLVRRAASTPDLISIARPYLKSLRDHFAESAWLGQVRCGRVILVAAAEAPHQLRLSFEVGENSPLHATAVGKAIAAYMLPGELDAVLGRGELQRFTRLTISNRQQLDRELAKVRREGFSMNREETVEGAVLIGAPIQDGSGKTFAAISVSSPIARCPKQKRDAMIREVKRAAAEITMTLGQLGFVAIEAVGTCEPKANHSRPRVACLRANSKKDQ